jgi:histidinol dehydrogenase
MPGVVCRRITRPIRAVGLYVPAGSAPLPSTVIMLAVPAALAGCPRRILCTPPQRDGRADPAVLTAARYCGIDEVYLAGGAQAVAAMAYGTESIPAVDKIFGPGNAWVTEAKLQVSRDPDGAALDLPAGPSEVLVIADERADPGFVAADLLSQAEHGPDSQAAGHYLRSPGRRGGRGDSRAAGRTAAQCRGPRSARARPHAHRRGPGRGLRDQQSVRARAPDRAGAGGRDMAVERIEVAGSVFLGDWTPESLGDYCSGTNHVLPTYGYARAWSGLSVSGFPARHLGAAGEPARASGSSAHRPHAGELERLDAHALAVKLRLEALGGIPRQPDTGRARAKDGQ